ncbi:MAG: hypothetical protein ACP5JG_06670 [Anaerolineae bacterium]
MTWPGLSRWDWLLASVTLGTLASLIQWALLFSLRPSDEETRPAQKHKGFVRTLLTSPWLIHPLRLLYAVGIPAAAFLWQRTLTTRGLGLQPLPGLLTRRDTAAVWESLWRDWARDLGWTVTLTASTAALVMIGDHNARRLSAPQPTPSRNLGVALREAVYHQVHWGFYREPFVITWGTAAGSWLGALAVLAEALLNPMVWQRVRSQGQSYVRMLVVRGGLLVTGTLLYLQTQNLWLAIVMDAVLGWLLLPPLPLDVKRHRS